MVSRRRGPWPCVWGSQSCVWVTWTLMPSPVPCGSHGVLVSISRCHGGSRGALTESAHVMWVTWPIRAGTRCHVDHMPNGWNNRCHVVHMVHLHISRRPMAGSRDLCGKVKEHTHATIRRAYFLIERPHIACSSMAPAVVFWLCTYVVMAAVMVLWQQLWRHVSSYGVMSAAMAVWQQLWCYASRYPD